MLSGCESEKRQALGFSQNGKNNSFLAETQTIQKQSLGLFELKFKCK